MCDSIHEWIDSMKFQSLNLSVKDLKSMLKKSKTLVQRKGTKLMNSLSFHKRPSVGKTFSFEKEDEKKSLESIALSLQYGFDSLNPSGDKILQFEDENIDGFEISTKEETKIMTDKDVLEYSLQMIRKPISKEQMIEKILQRLISFTRSTQLCLLRTNYDGKLVLDASLSPHRTWSLLKGLDISFSKIVLEDILADAKRTHRPVYIKTNEELTTSYNYDDIPFESVLCIPVVNQSRVTGCIYFTNNYIQDSYSDLDFNTVGLIAGYIIETLNNFSLKQSILESNYKNTLCIQNISDVYVQDTVEVYDNSSNSWKSLFIVLSKTHIYFFNTPFDSHYKKIIQVANIKKSSITSGKQFNRYLSSKELSNDRKLKKKESLIMIQIGRKKKEWFLFSHYDTAETWNMKLTKAMNACTHTSMEIPQGFKIALSDITKEKIIGKGGAGAVYRGNWNQNTVAIKELYDQMDKLEQKAFFSEMKMLASLRHPNIITLFGGYVSEKKLPCLVLEYASRGNLTSVLYDSDATLSIKRKYQIILQISQALSYLHSLDPPVIHRDLKPDNILLTGDWAVKLADFGLARKVAHSMTGLQGTVKWMAPEVLSNGPYSDKADIYSFSLILWEILHEEKFFTEFKFNSQLEVQVVNHDLRPPITNTMSESMKKLIEDCWNPDPSNRPSAAKVTKRLLKMKPADCAMNNQQ